MRTRHHESLKVVDCTQKLTQFMGTWMGKWAYYNLAPLHVLKLCIMYYNVNTDNEIKPNKCKHIHCRIVLVIFE